MKQYRIINSENWQEQAKQLIEQDTELIELSFACADLLEHLEEFYKQAPHLALASLIDKQQLLDFKQIASPWLETKMEVFAPALDLEIMQLIQEDEWMSQHLDYIPGVYSETDFDFLVQSGYKGTKFKIYPLDSNDLFKSMQGPYPELRNYQTGSKQRVKITSPRDYQLVRKQDYDYIFEIEQRDIQVLIDYIGGYIKDAQIIVSGLGGNLDCLKSLKGYDFVATRMNLDKYSSIST